jgi:uncharacterized protein (DUF488 family)
MIKPLRIYSIGHSSHQLEEFLGLLRGHGIEVLADVRSSPWSRFAPQFNRELLERPLRAAGVRYVFRGGELGGRPQGDEFYDDEGYVLYGAVAETSWFKAGVESLEKEARRSVLAMMCSEEDPSDCHRRLLVTRVVRERGVQVEHIRGDGRIVCEDELAAELEPQQELFAQERPWRSTRSVSHRRPRATSSAA